MHTRCLVILDEYTYLNLGGNDDDARERIIDYLDDQGFIGYGMNHWFDWASVGGRWSGVMVDEQLDSSIDTGSPDDIAKITPELYDRFLDEYADKGILVRQELIDHSGSYPNLQKEKIVDKCWLVIIDGHS